MTGIFSDPFVVVRSASGAVLHTSEVHTQDLCPKFSPFVLRLVDVGGLDEQLRVSVWDHDQHGDPDFLGHSSFFIRTAVVDRGTVTCQIRNDDKAASYVTATCAQNVGIDTN